MIPGGGVSNESKARRFAFLFSDRSSIKTFGFISSRPENKNAAETAARAFDSFAEEGGFEPPDPVRDPRFSRPVH